MQSALAIACGGQIERDAMQYRVRGASATTGIDATITVEAATASDAHAIASKRGMFVEAVDPIEMAQGSDLITQVPSYQTPRMRPEYSQLRREAGWTTFLGTILAIIGWVAMGLALVLFAIVVYQHAQHDVNPLPAGDVIVIVPTLIINAFLFWTASAVLRMLGFIGLAVRDIASNTRIRG